MSLPLLTTIMSTFRNSSFNLKYFEIAITKELKLFFWRDDAAIVQTQMKLRKKPQLSLQCNGIFIHKIFFFDITMASMWVCMRVKVVNMAEGNCDRVALQNMFVWHVISLPAIEVWAAQFHHPKFIKDGKNVRKSRCVQDVTRKKTVYLEEEQII